MKNQIKQISKVAIFAITVVLFLGSCEDDGPKGAYDDGAYIVNEGTSDNASISFYSYGADKVTNNIFNTVNDRSLGKFAQSLTVNGDKAFIVVNGSNKVEVVDKNTFKEIQTITDVTSPRYIEFANDKGFLTCWGDNSVKVINPSTHEITGSITVGGGPEKMVVANNKLYVANKGGLGADSTISVIDVSTEKVVKTITVKHIPSDMVVDANGSIWTLCSGLIYYDENWAPIGGTPAMLYKIDPATDEIVAEAKLFDDQHPSVLEIDHNGTFYFGGGFGFAGIYSGTVDGTSLNTKLLIDESAYGFTFDPNSKKLFVTLSPSFSNAGILKRYEVDGTEIASYEVGIGPNGASFKRAE